MGVAENKKVVLGFLEAFEAGDIQAAQAALADDATWWVPGSLPMSGTYEGKQAIFGDFLSQAGVLFEPGTLSTEVCDTIGEGDSVAIGLINRAKSAKGGDYKNYYHFKFKVKEGKIQAVKEYVDTLYVKEVLLG